MNVENDNQAEQIGLLNVCPIQLLSDLTFDLIMS